MKIESSYTYNFYNQNNLNSQSKTIKTNPYPVDTFNKCSNVKSKNIQFEGVIHRTYARLFKQDPINLLKDFSIKEYSKLSKKEIETLRTEYQEKVGSQFDENIKIHDLASDMLKKVFDETFGENNYVVITIGRSLSSIGKVLGYKIGEKNVINVPFSNAARFNNYTFEPDFYTNKLKTQIDNDNPQLFLKYLKSKGLTRNNVENSGKHYIIMDYCLSGYSLKGANNLFKSNFVFENKNHNIHSVDIIDLLNKCTIDNDQDLTTHFIDSCEFNLEKGSYKTLSLIKKSPKLEDTTRSNLKSKNLSLESRLSLFKLLDETISHPHTHNITSKNFIKRGTVNQTTWETPIQQFNNDITDDLIDINNLISKIETEYENNNIPKNSLDSMKNILYKEYEKIVDYIKGKNDNLYYENQNNIRSTIRLFRGYLYN